MSRTPAAVLWDFDGTLVDSEPLWQRVHRDVAVELGGTWTQQNSADMHGLAWPQAARCLLDIVGNTDASPDDVVQRWLELVPAGLREHVDWSPGARELLTDVVAAGVPCALVSASHRPLLEPVIEQLPANTFAAVVSGDEVTHGKPHPEPYLRAAELLGVDPRDCVVIEDSNAGCDSGGSAGAVVLGVPSEHPVAPGPRRVLVDSLQGLDWPGLVSAVEPAWDE